MIKVIQCQQSFLNPILIPQLLCVCFGSVKRDGLVCRPLNSSSSNGYAYSAAAELITLLRDSVTEWNGIKLL